MKVSVVLYSYLREKLPAGRETGGAIERRDLPETAIQSGATFRDC
jgi:hypothetical protein